MRVRCVALAQGQAWAFAVTWICSTCHRSLALIAALVLSGCQGTVVNTAIESNDLRLNRLPAVGSVLTLIEPIVVQPNSARSIVQHGVVTNSPELNTTWCTFYLHRSRETLGETTQINAGQFKVVYAWLHRESSYLPTSAAAMAKATAKNPKKRFRRWNHTVSTITYSTMMQVQSLTESRVHRIVCSVFRDSAWETYPMLGDIRDALAGKVVIDDSLD